MTPQARKDLFKAIIEKIAQLGSEMEKPQPFAGAQDGPPLEHTTRRLALDPMIEALGWDLSGLDIVEEARVVGDDTLFIDYLGVGRHDRVAEMIFEAKVWNAPMIKASPGRHAALGPGQLAALAATHVKKKRKADSPVTQGWIDKITQVYDYVIKVHKQTGYIVQRAVISSGRWIIVFIEPKRTFIDPDDALADHILALDGPEMILQSDRIYELLAAERLGAIPRQPIRASQLPQHISRPEELGAIYRALWVAHTEGGSEYKPRPSITLHPAAIVQRRDGALIPVLDLNVEEELPHAPELMSPHLLAVAAASDALLAAIGHELGITALVPSSILDFPGFPFAQGKEAAVRSSQSRSGNHLLVTGESAHFILAEPEVAKCGFHNYGTCLQAGMADSDRAVIRRSFAEKSFFTTGENHHCAHIAIRDAKATFPCPIAAFEQRLCCRTCQLRPYCWNERRLARAPCGTVAEVARPTELLGSITPSTPSDVA